MVETALFSLDVGTNKVSVHLPKSYGDIAAFVGLTKLAETETDIPPYYSVKGLVQSGWVMKVRLSFGNTTGKRTTATIICAIDKLNIALATLPGKTYNAKVIRTAYLPSRRRYT
ncbi:MAG TPA: hypothetical protein VIQ31_09260 [Phormidium sp.]